MSVYLGTGWTRTHWRRELHALKNARSNAFQRQGCATIWHTHFSTSMNSYIQDSDLTNQMRVYSQNPQANPKALELTCRMSRAEAYLLLRCGLQSKGSYCAGVAKMKRKSEVVCPGWPRRSSSNLRTERCSVAGGRYERTQVLWTRWDRPKHRDRVPVENYCTYG